MSEGREEMEEVETRESNLSSLCYIIQITNNDNILFYIVLLKFSKTLYITNIDKMTLKHNTLKALLKRWFLMRVLKVGRIRFNHKSNACIQQL